MGYYSGSIRWGRLALLIVVFGIGLVAVLIVIGVVTG
jgi:hypothetical protein